MNFVSQPRAYNKPIPAENWQTKQPHDESKGQLELVVEEAAQATGYEE